MRVAPKSSKVFPALAAICALIAFPLLAADAAPGIVPANMDPSVKPGDDFNQYANGGWIKRTEIPPDRGRIGVFTTPRRLEQQAHRRPD